MKTIYPYLTYAGAIPFVFCTVCLGLEIQQLPLFGSTQQILSVYALVIASFMAGAHWGQHLHMDGDWHPPLAILSNFMAILLWLGFLILKFNALVTLLISAFIILLLIDHRLLQQQIISGHYWQTRLVVTTIVIFSLIFALIFSTIASGTVS